MRWMAGLLAVATFAALARAEQPLSEAEDAYAALVAAARSHMRKGQLTASEAPTWERMPVDPHESELLIEALHRVETVTAAARVKPKAEEFLPRLAASREALEAAVAMGVHPGPFVRLRVRLVEGASGWDSVAFGQRVYPAFVATIEFRLSVPPKWLPELHPGTSVAQLPWACPQARFEVRNLDVEAMERDPAPWRAYLSAAQEFVQGALQAAHRPALPGALAVVEPPEPGHVFRPGSAPELVPVTRHLTTIREWAGEELTTHTTLPQLAEFRKLYDTIVRVDREADVYANCALLTARLVVEPLAPDVDAAEHAAERRALAPFTHRTLQLEVDLFDGNAADALYVGTLPRGTDIEILQGLKVEPGPPPVARFGPRLRVRADDLTGWMATTSSEAWKAGGQRHEEQVSNLVDDGPERRGDFGAVLREIAGTYFLQRAAADRAKARDDAASRAAKATLVRFCRQKARYLAAFGSDALDEETLAYRDQRADAGVAAAVVEREVHLTFADAGCGP